MLPENKELPGIIYSSPSYFYRKIAPVFMCVFLAAVNAWAITFEVSDKLEVDQAASFTSSMTIIVSAPSAQNASLWVSTYNASTPALYVSTTGLVGMGTASPGVRLDVHSTGSTPADMAQIWRNQYGTIVASVSATGVFSALSAEAMPGSITYFDLTACPPGWSEFVPGQNRYIVASASNRGSLVGSALTNQEARAVGRHAHPVQDTGHTHPTEVLNPPDHGADVCGACSNTIYYTAGDSADAAVANVTIVDAGPTAGTNAPYIQLLICQKD